MKVVYFKKNRNLAIGTVCMQMDTAFFFVFLANSSSVYGIEKTRFTLTKETIVLHAVYSAFITRVQP